MCVCVWGRRYREVTGSCNPSDADAKNIVAPLEEQEMFLSTEPSLQICIPSFFKKKILSKVSLYRLETQIRLASSLWHSSCLCLLMAGLQQAWPTTPSSRLSNIKKNRVGDVAHWQHTSVNVRNPQYQKEKKEHNNNLLVALKLQIRKNNNV